MVKIQVNSQGKAYMTSNGKVLLANEGGSTPTLVTKNITENGTYNASSDSADGYSSVTVNVSGGGGSPVIQSLSITPTTSSQTITAPSGTDGYSPIVVSAVTSNIDSNITAGNIKKDVTILGVTGSYEGSGGGSTTKYGLSIDDIFGDIDNNGALQKPSGEIYVTFSNVRSLKNGSLAYAFAYSNVVKSISFPDLTTISENGSLIGCFFNNTYITSVSFPELTTITGNNAMQRCFAGTYGLTSVSFPKLTTITGNNAMQECFINAMGLKDIYFNSLTASSFGTYTNCFKTLFNSVTALDNPPCTVHFPRNLESTISSLQGYPSFGADSSIITLAFDLPSTSSAR